MSDTSGADYIDRTIATVRQYRDANDSTWPVWTNVLADEIERLRAELESAERGLEIQRACWGRNIREREAAEAALREIVALHEKYDEPPYYPRAVMIARAALQHVGGVA